MACVREPPRPGVRPAGCLGGICAHADVPAGGAAHVQRLVFADHRTAFARLFPGKTPPGHVTLWLL